ncbi:MAG TPA: hypothetical protein VKQ27_15185 [Acetobacteraceae bacterium]|nr:hypothetical protein [Acetobacteraceae bacterium]
MPGHFGTADNDLGAFANTKSNTSFGVFGSNEAPSPAAGGGAGGAGVFGLTVSPGGAGVFGANNGPQGVGVQGNGPDVGVSGFSQGGSGVRGNTRNSGSFGVFGSNEATAAPTGGGAGGAGVFGLTVSPGGAGVFGANNSQRGVGVQGNGATAGVSGFSDHGTGVLGEAGNDAGVTGFHGNPQLQETTVGNDGARAGVFGASDIGAGVVGYSRSPGSFGVIAFGGIRASAINHPTAGEFNGAVQVNGNVQVTGDIFLQGADCAEHFDVIGAAAVEPGTVMVIDDSGALRESTAAYDRKVAGVVSGAGSYRAAVILDRQPGREDRPAVALFGKVYCKVDAGSAPVEVGDLLTSSATPGHAMGVADPARAFGAVIGKALGALRSGKGMIPILLALQ